MKKLKRLPIPVYLLAPYNRLPKITPHGQVHDWAVFRKTPVYCLLLHQRIPIIVYCLLLNLSIPVLYIVYYCITVFQYFILFITVSQCSSIVHCLLWYHNIPIFYIVYYCITIFYHSISLIQFLTWEPLLYSYFVSFQ